MSRKNVFTTSPFCFILIRFYQYCISPFFKPCCRFYPTCSEYATEAIKIHGALKGIYLATLRIMRCNPFNQSTGFDPVLENKLENKKASEHGY